MTVLPVGIGIVEWANVLRNEYPTQPIPILDNETNWKEWVKMLLLNRGFENYRLPEPDGFSNWQDWAAEFTLSIGA